LHQIAFFLLVLSLASMFSTTPLADIADRDIYDFVINTFGLSDVWNLIQDAGTNVVAKASIPPDTNSLQRPGNHQLSQNQLLLKLLRNSETELSAQDRPYSRPSVNFRWSWANRLHKIRHKCRRRVFPTWWLICSYWAVSGIRYRPSELKANLFTFIFRALQEYFN